MILTQSASEGGKSFPRWRSGQYGMGHLQPRYKKPGRLLFGRPRRRNRGSVRLSVAVSRFQRHCARKQQGDAARLGSLQRSLHRDEIRLGHAGTGEDGPDSVGSKFHNRVAVLIRLVEIAAAVEGKAVGRSRPEAKAPRSVPAGENSSIVVPQ